MSNRVNTSGLAPANATGRTSIFVNNVVAAGATLPVPVSGTTFYLVFATAALSIRPSNGSFNDYESGTGLGCHQSNAFTLVEVRNANAFPVVFRMFAGFDDYIDNRLFIQNNDLPLVGRPTYPTASAAAAVVINDISGQLFTDINGGEWYAVARKELLVFNPDGGITLLIQKAGSIVANGPAIGLVHPLTSVSLQLSGDYCLHLGGAMVNAIVSETYYSLRKT